MKRDLIIILIIDLVIVVGISGFIYKRYSDYIRPPKIPIQENPSPFVSETKTTETKTEVVFRNILFQYKSSKANKVAIIGDFNKWDPQPMTRGTDNLWKIAIRLSPGKYTYNYLVDGRLILDPNNRNVPVSNARGFKSSTIEIKPK
ncbi:MAG: hypothetical protein COY53_02885 [Elusimicrobia bacterium CG_4_10_14_0_8_um_filter_37_32]|nr:MAG: hypothetical protein COS17_00410 [Elusimicrobia bacterium CG02_land_8_20_14_3_00_37_13]PIZ13811.1 MAG: hypothetical protein COY53_02885 [Elusimicrobia bacterium CG_4_10_14_0_8_um_filter_37_32]